MIYYPIALYMLGLLAMGLGASAGKTKLGIGGSLRGGLAIFKVGARLIREPTLRLERFLFLEGLLAVIAGLAGAALTVQFGP